MTGKQGVQLEDVNDVLRVVVGKTWDITVVDEDLLCRFKVVGYGAINGRGWEG